MRNTKCTIFTTFRNIPPCGLSTFTGWAVTTTLVHTCSHPSALQEQENIALARPHQEAATKRLCFPRWNTDNTDKCFTSELSVGRHHLSLPTPPHSALDSEGPKSRGS